MKKNVKKHTDGVWYYAVVRWDGYGVFTSWDRAREECDGYSDNKKKKFKTFEEAKAYAEDEYRKLHGVESSCYVEEIVFDNAEESVERKEIEIIQLSGYGEQERKFAVTLLAEIYWEEVRQGKRKSEVVVFDEFQFLSLKPGSSLAAMLREGRKFSLAVYMSSQFLGNYSSEEIDTLMQAGNMLFFKPVPKERRLIAKYIDSKNWRQWEVILDDLNIGEAVLKGHFKIGENRRLITSPIKCSIS